MPRTPSIRYYTSRSAYYTQYHGKQHLLAAGPKDEPDGPTYRRAVEEFARIMHLSDARKTTDGMPVSAIISRYYHHLQRDGKAKTLQLSRSLLDPAIAAFGGVLVRDLREGVVSDWLAAMSDPERARQGGRPWQASTVSAAIGKLGRAFNLAVASREITVNPIARMKKPDERRRGAEAVLPAGLMDVMLASANAELRKVLMILRATGARPGEIIKADCANYDRSIGAIVHKWGAQPPQFVWKNARKTKRDRVIYLAGEERKLVEEEIAAGGGRGRILRTLSGLPWELPNLMARMRWLAAHRDVRAWCSAKDIDPDTITAYSFRHTYITRALLARAPLKVVADLTGTSANMIERVYSHAHDDRQAMRKLFEQVTLDVAAAAAPPSSAPRP